MFGSCSRSSKRVVRKYYHYRCYIPHKLRKLRIILVLVQDQNSRGLPVDFTFIRRETNVNMKFMLRNLTSIWNN